MKLIIGLPYRTNMYPIKKQPKVNRVYREWRIFGLSIIELILIVLLFYIGIIYTINHFSIQIAQKILDYLKVIIWPSAIIIVAFTFKQELSKLINRIISAEMPGLRINALPEQTKLKEEKLEEKLENIPKENKNKLEEVIREKEEKEATLLTAKEDVKVLLKENVKKQIELDFERIYNIIFSNQIDLLRKMEVLGYMGMNGLIKYFLIVKRAYEPVLNSWDLNKYLHFLYSQELIARKDANTIIITEKGKAFLQYLSIMGYQKFGM